MAELSITQDQAVAIRDDILRVVRKYGLWCKVEEDRRPDLRMITIREISIKVGKEA